jgi:uncharacterized protein
MPVPAQQPPAGSPMMSATSNEEKNWAVFTHLSALSGLLIPFGLILGPLVMWLIGKDKYPTIDAHGKEALNFNITMAIAMAVSAVLMLLLIGFILLAIVGITWLVLVIMATMKVANGESYRYPFSIRFLS